MSSHPETSIPRCIECGKSLLHEHTLVRLNPTGQLGVWRCGTCEDKRKEDPANSKVVDLDIARAGLNPPLSVGQVVTQLQNDVETLSHVLVIGVRKNGTLYTETSTYDAGEILYSIEQTKMKLMSGGLL